MECYRKYTRRSAGNRACVARSLFCRRRNAYLRQLCRGQETRTRIKTVYPLRPCQRCCDLWLGADDGSFQYRTGTYFNHYERRRLRNGTADGITVGNRDRR